MIESEPQLDELVAQVGAAPSIALDTEADSLHAYPEKLCLIQLSFGGFDGLVDPLAGVNLNALLEVLAAKELILHGADYDLRLLYRSYRFVPRRIFDTMWAARLLGYSEFSLSGLAQQHLGVALEKGPQKMNWALRPLSKRMALYAVNDTCHLHALAELLTGRLREKGRLGWMEEVCMRVIRDCSHPRAHDPEGVWRVKGSDRLDRPAMAVLRELWRWREEEALASNKPPYFVLSHERMVSISAAAVRARSGENMVPRQFPPKRAAAFLTAVERGLKVPALEYPMPRRSSGTRLTKEQQVRFGELKAVRDRRAQELELDPTIIASKADLVSLAQHSKVEKTDLMEWQKVVLAVS